MSSRNVTIDNAANATLISYQPPLCNGIGWSVNQTSGFGGSYTSCTIGGNVLPSANLSFTGVAVYYVSPNFEGASMQYRLDGVLSDSISLSTPLGQHINKTTTRIMWQQTELDNQLHTLEIFPGNGSTTLNVDAFIITDVDTTTITPSNSTTPDTSSGASLGLPTQSESTTRLSIGLGSAFGGLSFLIFLVIAWSLSRKNRRPTKRFDWSKPEPPVIPDDRKTTFDRQAFTQSSHYSPTSPQTENANVVHMYPIPPNNLSRGSLTSHDFVNDDQDHEHKGGWGSPSPSNVHLLHTKAPSSEGHGDTVGSLSRNPTSTRLEPMRAPSMASSSYRTYHTSSTPVDRYTSVSRTATHTSRLDPLRSSTLPPNFQPSSSTHYSYGDNGTSVSRSTTFSSRLEPVRKGTLTSGA